jgi:hypothetical protein
MVAPERTVTDRGVGCVTAYNVENIGQPLQSVTHVTHNSLYYSYVCFLLSGPLIRIYASPCVTCVIIGRCATCQAPAPAPVYYDVRKKLKL